jgi:hypothetical protein
MIRSWNSILTVCYYFDDNHLLMLLDSVTSRIRPPSSAQLRIVPVKDAL